MADQEVTLRIKGDATSAKKALKDVETGMSGAGKGIVAAASKASGALALIGTGAALAFGKQCVDAAKLAEVSTVALRQVVENSGLSWSLYSDKINTAVQATSRLAAVDDEDLQDALTRLIPIVGDTDEALSQLGLITDYARWKGVDLAASAQVIGKVYEGNFTALNKMGIKLGENATAMDYIDALNKRVGGSAEAWGKTSAGAAARASVAFENLKETIGASLLPVVTDLSELTAEALNGFNDLDPALQGVVVRSGEASIGVIALAKAFGFLGIAQGGLFSVAAIGGGAWALMWARIGASAGHALSKLLGVHDAVKGIQDFLFKGTVLEGYVDWIQSFGDEAGTATPKAAALAAAQSILASEMSSTTTEAIKLVRAMDGLMVTEDSLAGTTRTAAESQEANRLAVADLNDAVTAQAEVYKNHKSTADEKARADIAVAAAQRRVADTSVDAAAAVAELAAAEARAAQEKAFADKMRGDARLMDVLAGATSHAAAQQRDLNRARAGYSGPQNQPVGGHAAGTITSGPEYALIGEGGYPETVASWDPRYRKRTIGLLNTTIASLGLTVQGGGGGGNVINQSFTGSRYDADFIAVAVRQGIAEALGGGTVIPSMAGG